MKLTVQGTIAEQKHVLSMMEAITSPCLLSPVNGGCPYPDETDCRACLEVHVEWLDENGNQMEHPPTDRPHADLVPRTVTLDPNTEYI